MLCASWTQSDVDFKDLRINQARTLIREHGNGLRGGVVLLRSTIVGLAASEWLLRARVAVASGSLDDAARIVSEWQMHKRPIEFETSRCVDGRQVLTPLLDAISAEVEEWRKFRLRASCVKRAISAVRRVKFVVVSPSSMAMLPQSKIALQDAMDSLQVAAALPSEARGAVPSSLCPVENLPVSKEAATLLGVDDALRCVFFIAYFVSSLCVQSYRSNGSWSKLVCHKFT